MYFLSKMFAAALLLSLTAAAPTPEECVLLNKTLSAEELPMIFGKWILHEAYVLSSPDYYSLKLKSTNSSRSEFIPSEDNQTVLFKQAIVADERCTRYSINFTVVGNTIQFTSTTHNTTSKADFLKTCDDCLMMRHSTVRRDGKEGTYLLFYKKTDVLPQADQEKSREQAKCLGFLQPPAFIYEQAELCPEQSDAPQA
ncbi:saxitoxin and tetrodotoxin-binding protein 1-like [Dicentrarchus labrax]|uniref:saxitoxin and tetrodotoxin-binding protein 1-like n=1 Tax=Dicentrarchus labrax TaxID=13489 RepID=UPI0021F53854|nr:saxitoxin and tetrodotoxin-binding protein 1-like [Dicentrarchus labrax]